MFSIPFLREPSLFRRGPVPPIRMHQAVMGHIMCTIGSRQPETGGILLGPVGSDDITDFYFDATARCTSGTYTPDTAVLRKKMQTEWLPAGLDFKGFVHSHPGDFDRLSGGDIAYIRRLFKANPEMPSFAAPIVIPKGFRVRPIIVLREQPDVQHPTQLRFL